MLAPLRPRGKAHEEVTAAEPPPTEVTSRARCTAKPHQEAVGPADSKPRSKAERLDIRSETQLAPTHPSLQENPQAGGEKTSAGWSGWQQPHREARGEHAGGSLAAAAKPDSIQALHAVPEDEAGQRLSAAKDQVARALATPPQLDAAQKFSGKASQAALARVVSARRAAFEESPVLAVGKPVASIRTHMCQEASAALSAEPQAEAAKAEAAASGTRSHDERAMAPRRLEQTPAAATMAAPQRPPDRVAEAAVEGGSSARSAAWQESAAAFSSSSWPRSNSLESRSYDSSAVVRALAARSDGAAARCANAEGSPAKRRSAGSLSTVQARTAATVPSKATGAAGLPTLAKGVEVASCPLARAQVSCRLLRVNCNLVLPQRGAAGALCVLRASTAAFHSIIHVMLAYRHRHETTVRRLLTPDTGVLLTGRQRCCVNAAGLAAREAR